MLRLFSKIKYLTRRVFFSPIAYWEKRAQQFGELSVLNLNLTETEIKSLKEFQIATIFPLLKVELKGDEQTLLDFGCGPGRLSIELANFTNCHVTGVDPIEHLLTLAPNAANVSYKKIKNNIIPATNESFDVIWISFVLGGIIYRNDLKRTIDELYRILKKGGLLFITENTSNKENNLHWKYHNAQVYIKLLSKFNLVHQKDFIHGNEQFSILSGRKS